MVPVVAFPPVTPFTCQVTAAFDAPITVGVNVVCPNVSNVIAAGEMVTVTFWFCMVVEDPPPQPANDKMALTEIANGAKRRTRLIEPPESHSSIEHGSVRQVSRALIILPAPL